MTRSRSSTGRGLTRALSLAVALPAAGCSYYGKAEGERLANEVHAVQTQASAIQQALVELQEASKKQAEQLARIDRDVNQLNSAARRNDADLGVQLDEARQQVARLKGLVESSLERLSALESSVNKAQEEADIRFTSLTEQQRLAEKSVAEKQKAAAEAQRLDLLLQSPQNLFAEVDLLLKDNKAPEARKLLRELTIRGKDDKKVSAWMPDALYYIGETYYSEGNFQQAAAEYNGVRKSHPKSARVPDALYKLGLCFEKLNLPEDAKLFYQTIIQKHAKSGVAKDAKSRLDALK